MSAARDADALQKTYASLPDARLLEALAAGSDGFRDPIAYQVAQSEALRRGLTVEEKDAGPASRPGGVPRPSAWLLVAKLSRQGAWNPAERLPMRYVHFQTAFIIIGLLGSAAGAFFETSIETVVQTVLMAGVLVLWLAAVDSRRPWGWYAIVTTIVVSMLLNLTEFAGSTEVGPLVPILSTGFIGGLILLYFFRRRSHWGLPSWPGVM